MRSGSPAPLVLLALALPLLAGCLGDDAPDASAAAPAEPSTPVPQELVEEMAFAIDSGAGTPVVSVITPVGATENGGSFDVPANATHLLAEGEWTCDSPACTLMVTLVDGDGDVAFQGDGDGSLRIELDAPVEGSWDLRIFPSWDGSAVVNAAGAFRITVHHLATAGEQSDA